MTANLTRASTLALGVLFAWALWQAMGFRAQARMFPVVIAVTGLLLVIVYLAFTVRRGGEEPAAGATAGTGQPHAPDAAIEAALEASFEAAAEEAPPEVPPEVRRRRTTAILGWTVAFTLAAWLLGFPLSVPVATFAYLKLGAGESWLASTVFAVIAGAVFYGVFVEAVHIPFEDGLLLTLLPG